MTLEEILNSLSVARLDTGDIAYIRYDKTDDYPRLADRLRAKAYNQARDLAQYCRTSLGETVELLDNARVGLTDEEEALLDKIVDASHRAYTALKDTVSALWEWHASEEMLRARLDKLARAIKALDESDNTSNQ